MEFRAACSAAGPKLGDYTQWVRWRAPTKKNEKKQSQRRKVYPDRCARRQMRPGAVLKGVTLSSQLRLDVQKCLVQRTCAASVHPLDGRGARRLGVWDGRAGGTGLQRAWR